MTTRPTILAPSSTALERAIDQSAAARFGALPTSVIRTIWNAATCPTHLLPLLAWAVSVDEWDEAWSEEQKRAAINAAPEVHRIKGTPAAIERSLITLGQADAKILERADYIRCDGSVICDGDHSCGGRWATYRVTLYHPVTIGEAQLIKRTLEAVGRNAVELLEINFSAAAFRCDGTITANGQYSCGAVNMTIN